MVHAYAYLDRLLADNVAPFSPSGVDQMLALNEHVHYGDDPRLREEFASAIEVNARSSTCLSNRLPRGTGSMLATRSIRPSWPRRRT
jgi:hypothetical protein